MNAKWLLPLVLVCGVAMAFGPIADAGDFCHVKVRPPEQTAFKLAGRDWLREFAPDRPQGQIATLMEAVYHWVRSRADFA